MFEHLASLTWTFPADGREVAALAVYSEPIETGEGMVYRPFIAADSGMEGTACVDDVARAVVLGLHAWEQEGNERGRDLARRWLSFLPYMQGADGRFTNFILNPAGERNMTGQTSYPGGLWWTCRALWALGAAYRVLGDEEALEPWLSCPLPARAETASYAKVTGVLTLAALEVLRAEPPEPVRVQVQRLLERWAADLFGCMDGYLRDEPEQERVGLWGYHQFPALAEAGVWLERPDYLEACAQTVERVVKPTLAAGFFYAFPGVKEHQCAYCLTPMMQGLAALYRATGETRYRDLALRVYGWFTGENDAGMVMYDAQTGRCLDGITEGQASRNCGAESAIEAGFAELERLRLTREGQ
ncbi:MAG TPA: hypothetical protein VKT82_27745 [Ktedonobacterales bacterium]|nr:hypothetical protein [Ktedonobacterales bacterium]